MVRQTVAWGLLRAIRFVNVEYTTLLQVAGVYSRREGMPSSSRLRSSTLYWQRYTQRLGCGHVYATTGTNGMLRHDWDVLAY